VRRVIFMMGVLFWLCGLGAMPARAQSTAHSEPDTAREDSKAFPVDGVAARIEDDIILESEVNELAAFQKLVEEQTKPRSELIRELADQWIVRGEANTTKYPPPPAAEVESSYGEFVKQFGSAQEFQRRCADAGITEAAVRRQLEQQLYLAHFLDYRFRAAAQIDDKEVEKYYNDEFAPQLKARGVAVPALEEVEDTIREVLMQRAITERSTKWLDETRERLKIDIVPPGSGS
jgi:Ribbon-helix-helix protein, copG family